MGAGSVSARCLSRLGLLAIVPAGTSVSGLAFLDRQIPPTFRSSSQSTNHCFLDGGDSSQLLFEVFRPKLAGTARNEL